MSDLAFSNAGDLARKIRDKEVSSVELTDHFVDRIERLDGALNAVVVRDFERARQAARQADADLAAGVQPGPLHGVPMTIKESYNIAGLPTTWGLPIFKDNVAASDSQAVVDFKGAGAVFMGKTNVPLSLADFQSYNEIYGTTNNPWDVSRIPGGSSGGSAAALAAGLTALECGSDIGGSIRNPAHFCGVYGHKPTWGIVPPQGHSLPGMLAGPDIAVCGPLARSAEDLALALDVIARPEPLDRPGWKLDLPAPEKRSLADYKVAVWATDERCPVDSEIAERAVKIGDALARLGATVSDTARPAFDAALGHITYLNLLNSIMAAGIPPEAYAEAQAAAAQTNPSDLSEEAVMTRAAVLTHRDWLMSNNAREHLRYAWREFFDEWDILICPQMATPAFEHDHSEMMQRTLKVNNDEQPYFKQLFWSGLITASYVPSTVFPTGPSLTGLPIGLQAVGAEYHDRITIDFTRLLAREIGGFAPPPDYA
ncbi:MAG: amidase [Deltaproteobacteria bacterium]|nr:amidase [Deltaproteobacteria bacterium]MBW2415418.1 amidase [Deltaproteobacteria bacterium]